MKSTIISSGKEVVFDILSIDVVMQINKIPYASIILTGSDSVGKSVVDISKEDCFKPGKDFEISLASGGANFKFKGIVIKQTIRKNSNETLLIIDIKDKSHKLTLNRENVLFKDKNDKEIITEIAKKKSVDVECVEIPYKHKQIIQYYCTSWDFIISRAEANGLVVCPENGTLLIKKPDASSPAVEVNEIYDYEIETDFDVPYKEVNTVSWDMKDVKVRKVKNDNAVNVGSSQDFDKLSADMGTDKHTLVSGIATDEDEMKAWANGCFVKNRSSFLKTRISMKGTPKIKLGDAVKITGAGDIFNGNALISGIRHRINSEGWVTDIQGGLDNHWFYTNDDVVDKPGAGILPGINGLQIGIVEAYPSDGDPDKFKRIKVRIPAVDEKESVIWARLLFPYAGDKRGIFFIPETGDEVVIGFFNDDPRHAVILGSLYNGKTETPLEVTDKNNEKGIITRSGIKVVFTDEKDKEKIAIETPGGNKILIEDEKGMSLEDVNKNKINLTDKGISVEDLNKNKYTADDKGTIIEDANKNKLTCSSDGIVIKDSNGNTITLSSSGIEIKDANGNKAALEAGGVTIQSSANVTVKGSAVAIN